MSDFAKEPKVEKENPEEEGGDDDDNSPAPVLVDKAIMSLSAFLNLMFYVKWCRRKNQLPCSSLLFS